MEICSSDVSINFSRLHPSASILYSKQHSKLFLIFITAITWPDVTSYKNGTTHYWKNWGENQKYFESSCPNTGPVHSLTLSFGNHVLFHFVETMNHPLFTLYKFSEIERRLSDCYSLIQGFKNKPNRIRAILGAFWIEKLVQRKLNDTLFNAAYDWFLKTRHYKDYQSLPYGTPEQVIGSLLVAKKPYLVRKKYSPY